MRIKRRYDKFQNISTTIYFEDTSVEIIQSDTNTIPKVTTIRYFKNGRFLGSSFGNNVKDSFRYLRLKLKPNNKWKVFR